MIPTVAVMAHEATLRRSSVMASPGVALPARLGRHLTRAGGNRRGRRLLGGALGVRDLGDEGAEEDGQEGHYREVTQATRKGPLRSKREPALSSAA